MVDLDYSASIRFCTACNSNAELEKNTTTKSNLCRGLPRCVNVIDFVCYWVGYVGSFRMRRTLLSRVTMSGLSYAVSLS